MSIVLKTENLGKRYRLGVINRGMLYKDLQSWWARLRGHEDPHEVIDPRGGKARSGDFWALR
jgi:lipopolysaccharide transport system ATP-binding protein